MGSEYKDCVNRVQMVRLLMTTLTVVCIACSLSNGLVADSPTSFQNQPYGTILRIDQKLTEGKYLIYILRAGN